MSCVCVHVYIKIHIHTRTNYTCASVDLSECMRRNTPNDMTTILTKATLYIFIFVYIYI